MVLSRKKISLPLLKGPGKYSLIPSCYHQRLTAIHRIPASKYPMLQQSVTLTGLGTSQFEESVEAMKEFYSLFEREFPADMMVPWLPGPCSLSSGRTMSFTNRFFTKRTEALTLKAIPFSYQVDPKGFLNRMTSKDLFHAQENQVQYLKRVEDMEAGYRSVSVIKELFE